MRLICKSGIAHANFGSPGGMASIKNLALIVWPGLMWSTLILQVSPSSRTISQRPSYPGGTDLAPV